MSEHDEVMARLDWLTQAVKHLLGREVVELTPLAEVEREVPPDPVPTVVPEVCAHRNQSLRRTDSVLICADCGHPFGATGVISQPTNPEEFQ